MIRPLACLLMALYVAPAHASSEPDRLFYTPQQRAQLEQMRARPAAQAQRPATTSAPPIRFDGVVVRSDGRSTRWVNGRAQVGANAPAGLKPGQVRAEGKTYELYQVLPLPDEAHTP